MKATIENKASAAGLSDLLPLYDSARALIMLELFAGVGCVAVGVSRWFGMTLQSRSMPKPD